MLPLKFLPKRLVTKTNKIVKGEKSQEKKSEKTNDFSFHGSKDGLLLIAL